MIKESKPKLWQKIYFLIDKWFRKFGNPYTRKLYWYCDKCKRKIIKHRYVRNEEIKTISGLKIIEQHYCEICK